MAYIAISLADLLQVPGFPEAYGESVNDDTALKALLHGCGLDVEKEWDWHYCKHRQINGNIVECDRVEGFERFDREWLDSGYSTYDARIDSYEDISFRVELRKLRHVGCVDILHDSNEGY